MQCLTTMNDATDLGKSPVSACLAWKYAVSCGKKVTFLIFDVSSWCFGYCCCYCMGWMLKIPQVLQNRSPSGQQKMYFLFLSQNFVLLLSTLVKHRCFSSCYGYIFFFLKNLIPYTYIHTHTHTYKTTFQFKELVQGLLLSQRMPTRCQTGTTILPTRVHQPMLGLGSFLTYSSFSPYTNVSSAKEMEPSWAGSQVLSTWV